MSTNLFIPLSLPPSPLQDAEDAAATLPPAALGKGEEQAEAWEGVNTALFSSFESSR